LDLICATALCLVDTFALTVRHVLSPPAHIAHREIKAAHCATAHIVRESASDYAASAIAAYEIDAERIKAESSGTLILEQHVSANLSRACPRGSQLRLLTRNPC